MNVGSPPRVRGKVIVDLVLTKGHRITPACVGKSHPRSRSARFFRDHPRVCGEKHHVQESKVALLGSPPRMRGKAVEMKLAGTVHGITPACAGKRCRSPAFRSMPWDHPRVCGEKLLSLNGSAQSIGSSPHVRGKGQGQGDGCDHQGITPACAGKRGCQCSGL